ncbi:hypothetical protein HY745_13455 [Candidatus Desantisbacteria bacterium]|nr:hypothetical protein [Candidatus Desantisbacteria bacterium]
MFENFRFFKIVLILIASLLLLSIISCSSGADKDITNNNIGSLIYTNADLTGTWMILYNVDSSTKTITFNSNGTYTSIESGGNGTNNESGTFKITNGNILTLVHGNDAVKSNVTQSASIAIKGNDLAFPALKVINIGTDGQGPIGEYEISMESVSNDIKVSYSNSTKSIIKINGDNTYSFSGTSVYTNSQGTTKKRFIESGTWLKNTSGALIIKTTFISDDPTVTLSNPNTKVVTFYHLNDNWAFIGDVFKKQ